MCGRYVTPTMAEMERYWQLSDAQIRNPLEQRFNVSPSSTVPMIYQSAEGLQLIAARWGLVPFWWKEPKAPGNTFNARSEEAASKPMWRTVASKSRCIVPALGWYEWKEAERIDPTTGEVKKVKQPYLMRRANSEPLAFAGFMSRWKSEGVERYTCTVVTRDAVGVAAQVHNRMPIALPKAAEADWLDPTRTDAKLAIEAAREATITDLMLGPVNPKVGNTRNEGPDLIEPFANPA